MVSMSLAAFHFNLTCMLPHIKTRLAETWPPLWAVGALA